MGSKRKCFPEGRLVTKKFSVGCPKECHPIAVKFGNKYGDDDVLLSVAKPNRSGQQQAGFVNAPSRE